MMKFNKQFAFLLLKFIALIMVLYVLRLLMMQLIFPGRALSAGEEIGSNTMQAGWTSAVVRNGLLLLMVLLACTLQSKWGSFALVVFSTGLCVWVYRLSSNIVSPEFPRWGSQILMLMSPDTLILLTLSAWVGAVWSWGSTLRSR